MKKKVDKKQILWDICEKYIKEQNITCPETIYQVDSVIENAYYFIDEIVKVVGYAKEDE